MAKQARSSRYEKIVDVAADRLRTRKKELEIELGRKISLRDLQAETGIDAGSLSEILRGKQPEVSAGNFFTLCEALKTDPMKVWYGDERRPPRRSEPPPASVERPTHPPPPPPRRRSK
ncbi:MAG TPA: helix-turn-helix transcriptional regulator [Polyangiaceae bacterium]|nr:helix-turn-helix transcriptional regulator [Polyangiaceae bacterium]